MSTHRARGIARSGSRIGRNAHIALRAERVIARRRLAVMRQQTALMVLAGVLAAIGAVMVNVAAFYWLSGAYGNAPAGAILAALNLSLAGLLALRAARMSAEQELEPIMEMRDEAMEEIEAELAEGLDEARQMAQHMRQLAADPLGAAVPALLGPILSVLMNALRK
jgi:fatty acid desaturase